MADTIKNLISFAERKLRGSGISTARLDAEVLLSFTLGCGREKVIAGSGEEVPESIALKFLELIDRRSKRFPLQYLTHRQEFYSLEFFVDERVLIPRSETELIVDEVLKLNHGEEPVIADVGTGSGNLAVTLACQIPGARVFAIDSSQGALDVARMNAEKHGVSERIAFLEGDFLSPIKSISEQPSLDFIVSNPPYVLESEIGLLQEEVKNHEPRQALVPKNGALGSYSKIIPDGFSLLRNKGALILEIGSGQSENVRRMVSGFPFSEVYIGKDLQGIDRMIVALK
ncbi:MAG: peptide chain release factor N(5)-glutamine methyltransferase [Acidobacteriota bacterium]